MRSLGYRWVGLLMLTLHVGGCYTWRSVPRAAGLQVIEEEQPREVRLQRTDGTEVEVRAPMARNDTIIWANGTESLAYADVSFIDLREIDTLKSIGFGVALPILLVAALANLACLGSTDSQILCN